MDLKNIAHKLATAVADTGVEIMAFFVQPPESNYEINNMKYWSDFGFSGKVNGQPFSLNGKVYLNPDFNVDSEVFQIDANVESEPDMDETVFDWGGKIHERNSTWPEDAVDAFQALIDDPNFNSKWDSISKTAEEMFDSSEARSDFIDISRSMNER